MKKILSIITVFLLGLFMLTGCETIKKSAFGVNNVLETTEITADELRTELSRVTPVEDEQFISIYVYGKVMGLADFSGNIEVDVRNTKASANLKLSAGGGLMEAGYAKGYYADGVAQYDAAITIVDLSYSGTENFEFELTTEGLNKLLSKFGVNYTRDYSEVVDELEGYTAGRDANGNIIVEYNTEEGDFFRLVFSSEDKLIFAGGKVDTKTEAKVVTFNATFTYGSANVVNPF